MLKKNNRINRKEDYNHIYNNGKKIQAKYIILFLTTNNLDYNRFGIVTSKKVGHAVQRNLAKRRIRAIIKNYLPVLKPGFDLVIVARYSIKDALYTALEKDFLNAIKKARLD